MRYGAGATINTALWGKKARRGMEVVARAERKTVEELISEVPCKAVLLLHYSNGDLHSYHCLQNSLQEFGPLKTLRLAQGNTYGYAEFETSEAAERAVKGINKDSVVLPFSPKPHPITAVYTPLPASAFAFFVADCVDSLPVPGLALHPGFLSLSQETDLLSHLKTGDWTVLTNRRVQCYGKEAERLGGRADLPHWAQEVKELVEERLQVKFDGLQIEAFLPRDSSPIPTPSTDVLAVLNLAQPGAYTCQKDTTASSLWLPERALLALQEASSAYKWTVQARVFDMYRGFAVYRKERFSITFRKAKTSASSRPAQSPIVPTPSFLQQFVHSTYDEIAAHFDHTRHRPWPQVQRFLSLLSPGSLVLDIGCGNGKYLAARPDCSIIGLERSQGLANIVAGKGLMVLRGDALAVPIRSNSIDAVLCVAVIHHFPTEEMRLQAVRESLRVLKPGGLALIYVWAKEQSERQFDSSDCLLPWNSPSPKPAPFRYYHVFEKGELDALVRKATDQGKVESSYYDHSNWCVVVRKAD